MNTLRFVLLGTAVLFLAPLAAQAGKRAKASQAPSSGLPSAHLRQLIDMTLPKISNITNPKQPPLDRTTIMVAQAEYSAKVQTGPPAQQPMYQAALNVITNLVAAVDEHEKAVADYHYSKNVHGKQDREDAKVAIWQRGPDAGAAGRADNAKQQMENEASRKALLEKEKFMNNGTAAAWTQRVGQLHDVVEQSLTTELVAETRLAMATPATPTPAPIPKATPKPAQTSAADQYSPAGTWKGPRGTWTLTDDGNFVTAPNKNTGTWEWSDRAKRELRLKWTTASGGTGKAIFSADGKSLNITLPYGKEVPLTR